jgi:hypothetical protein
MIARLRMHSVRRRARQRRSRALLALATSAALTLAACGDDSTPSAPVAPAASPSSPSSPSSPAASAPKAPTPAVPADAKPPIAAPPAAPAGPSGPIASTRPAFASAAECGKCHQAIYAEWSGSMHGQAMTDPHFLKQSEGLKLEECIRCHAPVPLREMDNWETPIARNDRREDADSCLSCHQAGANVAGPNGFPGPCRPVKDSAQTDVTKVCFACHNQHKLGEEWLAGPYAPDAPTPRKVDSKSCLDCHMPVVERPLVEGGVPRKGRRHTWPGGHDMDQLERAAKLEVETSAVEGGTRIQTWLTNAAAGHNIPSDSRFRSFDTYVKVWDADDHVIVDPLDADPAKQAKSQTAKYRLQFRNSSLADTQIPPLARVSGLGGWKGTVDVPVKKGRGEAWLVYRLTPDDALVAESLTDRAYHMNRARRVIVVPFTFESK